MTEPLSWSHRGADVPEAGLEVTRAATSAERAAVAQALGILACDALSADYRVRPLGEGRYRMTGKLSAQVTQECVVTLEPVAETIAEELDVAFWPADSLPPSTDAEVEVLTAAEIEPIEHGQIEAGRVLFEILSASLDPYPRKPGARFEWEDASPGAAGPFAGLKKLRNEL
ncbi:MAG TPA: YceD family protein [Hyphomicrobium sp.]|jgi:hypothetical protein